MLIFAGSVPIMSRCSFCLIYPSGYTSMSKSSYSGRQIKCTMALVILTPIAQNYENKNIFSFKIRILH